MKKGTLKKLSLSRETLKPLEEHTLDGLEGADRTPPVSYTCRFDTCTR
jgi:hypothetical protein